MRPGIFLWTALWTAAACAAALALAQDGEAPPAIAQGGIVNAASLMPPLLAAGGIAPGSRIRIRGWRLGPVAPEKIMVRIRQGASHVETPALTAGENDVEAQLPADTPLGAAMLQVVKNGQASLEWPVAIVESSFGAYSRNGGGWGPGDISNTGGTVNSEAHPARPGETVMLAGTGLGAHTPLRPPRVLVAGHAAGAVRVVSTAGARTGIDKVEFRLPADTPEGCHVPVQVSSAPGIYSNAVTLAVSRSGGPCADQSSWMADAGRKVRVGTVALIQADLEMGLTPKEATHYPVDAGFASFAEMEPGASANPLFLFPPEGTCTTYSGTAGLHAITSPLSALEALPGKPLDAGVAVTVAGHGDEHSLPRSGSTLRNYWAVMGGHAPVPGAKELPLFLTPGDYQVHVPGSSGMAALEASVAVGAPLIWRNREQLNEVDRARGVAVTWKSTRTGGVVLIVAMNADARTGALGVCACVVNAGSGRFQIPPYALANIPPTPEHPRGFPLNLMILVELPDSPAAAVSAGGLDRVLAFAASLSARTVRFK
jgi:uncharacterized protein (TIGR03437 family)